MVPTFWKNCRCFSGVGFSVLGVISAVCLVEKTPAVSFARTNTFAAEWFAPTQRIPRIREWHRLWAVMSTSQRLAEGQLVMRSPQRRISGVDAQRSGELHHVGRPLISTLFGGSPSRPRGTARNCTPDRASPCRHRRTIAMRIDCSTLLRPARSHQSEKRTADPFPFSSVSAQPRNFFEKSSRVGRLICLRGCSGGFIYFQRGRRSRTYGARVLAA